MHCNSALQHTNALQHTAMARYCNTLQCIATHCNGNRLQQTAIARHCNTLQHIGIPDSLVAACTQEHSHCNSKTPQWQDTATHLNSLGYQIGAPLLVSKGIYISMATHCNGKTLQDTTTYCKTLQHIGIPDWRAVAREQGHLHFNTKTLQDTARHCNILQDTATHWDTKLARRCSRARAFLFLRAAKFWFWKPSTESVQVTLQHILQHIATRTNPTGNAHKIATQTL